MNLLCHYVVMQRAEGQVSCTSLIYIMLLCYYAENRRQRDSCDESVMPLCCYAESRRQGVMLLCQVVVMKRAEDKGINLLITFVIMLRFRKQET